jgi:hypothetical protein
MFQSNSFCRNLFVSLIVIFCTQAYAQNPSLPPGSNFDLNAWKLQTLDQSLVFTEISASSLGAGYTSSFFYTDPTDGSIVCRVPSNGGTTSGSSYPRVEFRQMGNGANWVLNDATEHYLTAQCKVLAVAQAKPQTIIGQIHGSNTVSEMIKLRWSGYRAGQCFVEARFKTNDVAMTEYGVTLASGLSLGDLITYTITMKNGTVTCTVNGTTGSQTYTPDIWKLTDAYYFKAGNYFQYNPQTVPDPTVIYGQNQFYKLSLVKLTTDVSTSEDSHQPDIYPNPANDRIEINCSQSAQSAITIGIYDWKGTMVKKQSFNDNESSGNGTRSMSISDLPCGVYCVKQNTVSHSRSTKLIITR